jgi:hypothetical protein
MIARNVTESQMYLALAEINQKYDGNIVFKSFEKKGKGFSFTLTVKETTRGKGKARIAAPGVRKSSSCFQHERRIAAACWHVHGHFFEELFKIAPDARVFSTFFKRFQTESFTGWITKDGGNWLDGNIGSTYSPMMFSEACFCND